MTIPSSYADPEYFDYEKEYAMKSYDNDHKKLPIIQNNKCSNIIMNGIDNPAATLQGNMPTGMLGENDQTGLQNLKSGNYYDDELNNINRNIVICTNINNNLLGEADEVNVPQTGSLTVKKEIFGCDNIINDEMDVMDCASLNNDSPDWISCDNPNDFSNPEFCQKLPRNFFDIEVLNDQNNQLQLFEGSQEGITIPNLEPGLYSVNEIIHLSGPNQLEESQSAQNNCNNAGFAGGGILEITSGVTLYTICFEYEDQQGNDCTMTTLAAGEDKTCIVKNYIRFGDNLP